MCSPLELYCIMFCFMDGICFCVAYLFFFFFSTYSRGSCEGCDLGRGGGRGGREELHARLYRVCFRCPVFIVFVRAECMYSYACFFISGALCCFCGPAAFGHSVPPPSPVFLLHCVGRAVYVRLDLYTTGAAPLTACCISLGEGAQWLVVLCHHV